MVYSTRRFVVCLSMCQFVLVLFSPYSIAITSLGEERANLSAFRAFVRFVLVWICRFSLPLGVLEGLRFVLVALPGLFSYSFFYSTRRFVLCLTFYVLPCVIVPRLFEEKRRDTVFGFPWCVVRSCVEPGVWCVVPNF